MMLGADITLLENVQFPANRKRNMAIVCNLKGGNDSNMLKNVC
jgi:hypothetical protein